jgi:putative MATE family efflux protein
VATLDPAAAPPGTAGSDPAGLRLFTLTWPILLELLLFMLMGTADTLMLSGVSDAAASAVGVANHLVFVCILMMEVVSHGGAIVVSQYLGARRGAEAGRIAALALTLNLLLGFVMSAAMALFGGAVLRAMNLQGEVLAHAEGYLSVVGGFLFLQALINAFSGLLRTYGFTRQSMLVALGMNVLHVGGNAALIFGGLGLPALGVQGAALSTVASRAVAVGVFAWSFRKLLAEPPPLSAFFTLSREHVRKILKVGVPSAVETVTYHLCQTVFIYYVTFLGPAALASRQYAMAVSHYVFLFSLAVGMGTSVVVGRLVGAGRPEEAYRRALQSLKWSVGVTVAVDALVILFREPLVRLFTADAEVLVLTSRVLLLSMLLETGRAFNLVLVNALRASGDAAFPLAMGFLSMAAMSVPLGYVLALKLHLGLAGVWLAIAADEWTRGLAMWARWRGRAWQRKALVTPQAPGAAGPEAAVAVAVGG